jgi:ABC-type Mn2+/Zn2+ transport system ATPase subunit
MKADKSASEEGHTSLADVRSPFPAKFLTKLTVKSWKLLNLSVSFSLNRTTIVGPVGSGKSSVLDAIFACFASNEMRKWDQSMGVGPKKDDRVSILTEGMLRGKRWEIELDSEGSGGGTKGISNFRLTKSLKQSIRVLYVPQDYGTRSPDRYDRFSWCLTWKKFLNGDFNRDMDDLDFKRRLARICGLEFKDDKFYNVAADSEIPFIHLSGGQIDAILCLLAITLSAKMSDECLVLFDEPGQNLGAHERELLRRQIFSCNAQVIIITHHVEMLDRTSLPNGVIRFLRPSGTLHRKRSELTANMADLGEEIAENLDKEEAQNFIKFLRLPENLPLLFASSLLLVEGFSDVRTLLALDEIWKKSGWIGLNCLIVNCNGKSSVFLVWRCLQVLFESLQLPAFALLDLDALFKDALKLSDNDDGVQGGHVYYTLGAKPKIEHLGWLLNSVIEEDNRVSGRKGNLLQPTTVEAVLDQDVGKEMDMLQMAGQICERSQSG